MGGDNSPSDQESEIRAAECSAGGRSAAGTLGVSLGHSETGHLTAPPGFRSPRSYPSPPGFNPGGCASCVNRTPAPGNKVGNGRNTPCFRSTPPKPSPSDPRSFRRRSRSAPAAPDISQSAHPPPLTGTGRKLTRGRNEYGAYARNLRTSQSILKHQLRSCLCP